MARGFLAGAIWGTAVAAVGLGTVSVMTGTPRTAPMPDKPAAEVAPPVAADPAPSPTATQEAVAQDAAEEPVPATTTDEPAPADTAPTPVETAERPAPKAPAEPLSKPDPGVVLPGAGALAQPQDGSSPPLDTATGPTPEVSTDIAALPEAKDDGQAASVPAAVDATPRAEPLPGPVSPVPETTPTGISTEPAQPPAPDLPGDDSAFGMASEPATEAEPDVAADDGPATADIGAEPGVDDTAPRQPALPSLAGDDNETETPLRPQIGEPAVSLLNREQAVPTRRIGQDEENPEAATDDTETDAAAQPPLIRYAAPSSAAATLPRLAVVLIDDGSGPLGPAVFKAFPFPISIAIDPSHPDAAGAAAAYRAAGLEVLAVARVPQGATATDVEIALAGVIDAVPEAVAVIEDPAGGMPGDRAVSDQVAAFLKASGHGLLMQARGLNTAQQLAARAGVPSAPLFRDIDGQGENAAAIRRVLDQAAFKARQDGAVTLLGRLRADTVSALVQWGLQDRSGEIALVPASLILRESVSE
ncbi:divergent polysaccharide deacetylase family protein [Thalassococcus sp. CAU 1522]|uniref:Divergent polysaccharide deacetylase family protein n=1 Tax=Thalassococcus arenae TaxID=2851652 RepID=A0ABS6NAZ1_9RHOB|nr:divergent polysaccharide deacetylase family protein [Thalassococcus arenae]MBV2361143.1 divergent polysaccharide deacetylase family protein [Thalassococcus arenae]